MLDFFFGKTKERDTRIGALAAALKAQDETASPALVVYVLETDGADKNIPAVIRSALQNMAGWKNPVPAFQTAVNLARADHESDLGQYALEKIVDLSSQVARVKPSLAISGLSTVMKHAPRTGLLPQKAADEALNIVRRSQDNVVIESALRAVAGNAPDDSAQKTTALGGLLGLARKQKETSLDQAIKTAAFVAASAPAGSAPKQNAGRLLIEMVKDIKDDDARKAFEEFKRIGQIIGAADEDAMVATLAELAQTVQATNRDFAAEIYKYALESASEDSTAHATAAEKLMEFAKAQMAVDQAFAVGIYKFAAANGSSDARDKAFDELYALATRQPAPAPEFAFEVLDYLREESDEDSEMEEKAYNGLVDLAKAQKEAHPKRSVEILQGLTEDSLSDDVFNNVYGELIDIAKQQMVANPEFAKEILKSAKDNIDSDSDLAVDIDSTIVELAKAQKNGQPDFAFDLLKTLLDNGTDDDTTTEAWEEMLALAEAHMAGNAKFAHEVFTYVREHADPESDEEANAFDGLIDLAKAQQSTDPKRAFEALKDVIENSSDDDVIGNAYEALHELAKAQISADTDLAYEVLKHIIDNSSEEDEDFDQAYEELVDLAKAQAAGDAGQAFETLKEVVENNSNDDVLNKAWPEVTALARAKLTDNPDLATEILDYIIENAGDDSQEKADAISAYVAKAQTQRVADPKQAFANLKHILENVESGNEETVKELAALGQEMKKSRPDLAREIFEYIVENVEDDERTAEAIAALTDIAAEGKMIDAARSVTTLDFVLNHEPDAAIKTRALGEAFDIAKSVQASSPQTSLRAASLVNDFADAGSPQAVEVQTIIKALDVPDAPISVDDEEAGVDIQKYLADAKPMKPEQFKAEFH